MERSYGSRRIGDLQEKWGMSEEAGGRIIRVIFLPYATQNPKMHEHEAAQKQIFLTIKKAKSLSVNVFRFNQQSNNY